MAQNDVSTHAISGVLHPSRKASSSLFKERLTQFVDESMELLADLNSAEFTKKTTPAELESLAIGEIRRIIAARTLRSKFLTSDYFGDPAWDIMLDLALARAESRRVSISSACIAAGVPTTTALRWVRTMINDGVVTVMADPKDSRRRFVQLSHECYTNMVDYAAELLRREAGC